MSNKQHKQKESFFNLHFTSTISISLVLFTIGIISLIFQTSRSISQRTQESLSVTINLDDSISDANLSRLQKYIAAAPYIQESVYISKDSALTEHIEMVGENPVDFIGYNPLRASIELHLNQRYAHIDSIQNIIIPKLQVFEGIVGISYQEEIFDILEQNISRLTILFAIITLTLLLISIVLINNTIRISIYSKRFIIRTMQLVGARNRFIRRPFIRRAMINATISTIIALILLALTIYLVSLQFGIQVTTEAIIPLLPIVVIVAAVSYTINYIATIAAVNRYLRLKTSQLYFI